MAKYPYIGDLRHSVTLQTRVASTDTGGGFTSTFTNTRNLMAKVVPKLGNENYEAGRLENPITHEVYTRYYSDINFSSGGGRMRISWSDSGTTRTLSVKSVIDVGERDRFLVFRCSEGAVDDT
jgi:SPP1 family predicted phage head-tail adaptor